MNMEPFFFLAVFAGVFGLVGLAAARWGVDSRDGFHDPRGPIRPTGLSV